MHVVPQLRADDRELAQRRTQHLLLQLRIALEDESQDRDSQQQERESDRNP